MGHPGLGGRGVAFGQHAARVGLFWRSEPTCSTVPREIQCGSKCTIRVEPAARHIGGFSEPWSYSSGEDPSLGTCSVPR
jgi:hypothetical protein